jgi:nucleoside-diphosphate-sugar epimerase
MATVLVTGAAGRLGRLAVQDLLDHGFQVRATDRVRPAAPLDCKFLPVELAEDPAGIYEVTAGVDTVLHLGAIPGPGGFAGPTIFRNNVQSTYNVVEAAATLHVDRVVFASTVFALGWHEDPFRYWPDYLPVDEEHPQTPFEAYGLSKQIGEQICAAACRRTGMRAVSLRIMNVIQPDGYGALPWRRPSLTAGARFVIWPYVDARDVVTACRLALEAPLRGHEAAYVAAPDTRFDCPTEELLSELAPPDIVRRGPLEGRASVIDIRKAEQLLGWRPQYTWQQEVPTG